MFFCVGPRAKFFSVVPKHQNRTGAFLSPLAAVFDRFFGFGKRNQISQMLAAGKYAHDTPLVFHDVVSGEFFLIHAGASKVIVIQNGVLDSSVGDRRRQARFPDALWNPHAFHFVADTRFEPSRKL